MVWFKLKTINIRLKNLDIVFDYRKMKYYVLFKITLLSLVATLFLATDVLIRRSMGLYYTLNYWITALFPLNFSVVVGIIFGSCTLCLYQRFWVINEFIRRSIQDYEEKSRQYYKKRILGRKFYSEKALEEVIFEGQELDNKISIISKQRVINPEKIFPRESKKIPMLVMVQDYPRCFMRGQRLMLHELRQLREIHFQLYDLTIHINALFGSHFLFIFVTYFFGCTINLYFAITFHLRTFQMEQYASACLWAAVYLFLIIYLITYSNIASNEVSLVY